MQHAAPGTVLDITNNGKPVAVAQGVPALMTPDEFAAVWSGGVRLEADICQQAQAALQHLKERDALPH